METLPAKPQIYNRPWHLDLDDRRHQGARQWEREALQALVDLAGTIESLYPPDWSAKDLVTFRGRGRVVFAALRTDSPAALSLSPKVRGNDEVDHALDRLGSSLSVEQPAGTNVVVRVKTAAEVHSHEFREWFRLCAESFCSAPSP